jgi:hypothetical protein
MVMDWNSLQKAGVAADEGDTSWQQKALKSFISAPMETGGL